MVDDLARDVLRRWERLKGDRGTTEQHWQDITNHMLPDRADYTLERTAGTKRMQFIYDSTPLWAVQQAAAGLHGYMVSPTERWFTLRADDDRMSGSHAVAAWFEAASNWMYGQFSSPRLNFATQAHEFLTDQFTIGTSVMAVLERPTEGTLFSAKHMRECVLEENEEDRVDGVVRRWHWTARQAYAQWGEAAGEKVLKALADGKDSERFAFLHQSRPRAAGKRDPQRRDAKHKPFESVYVSEADKAVIAEGGFDEFPYMAARFSKATGEVNGRGPGSWMLPDCKMAQQMMRSIIEAAQIQNDPPLAIPEDTFILPVRSTPGARNLYRAGARDQVRRLYEGGEPRIGIELLRSTRESILRGFFVDWMVMPSDLADPASSGKGVTATYTLTQRDQKMKLLSPLLARQRAEFLGPLISRLFAIGWRQSVALKFGPGSPFPPPPPELSGMPWKVEYISPAELAQRFTSLDTIGRLVQQALLLGQIDPSVPHILNAEEILRDAARALNASATSLRSPEEVAARNAAMQQQQQLAAATEAAAGLAGAAKDGTAAMKNAADARQMQVAA